MSDLITYLTKVRFGSGAIGELAEELAAQGVERPIVITDRGLLGTGLVAEALEKAGMPDLPVFADTPENPTEDAVDHALAFVQQHEADGLIALGGGSSIDLAKGVALLATHEGPLEKYAAIRGGVARIGAVLPLIAVPTTAGTGSEVGRAALITLRDERKLGFISPHLIPSAAICDPELTLSLPPRLTAATGLDAISHCVETYLSPKRNPPAEAIALDGLRRATNHIRRAVREGADIEARSEMMMAALQGALAFQKGLGAIHSVSHALGGLKVYRLHHGTLNAVLLPHVIRVNAPACIDKYSEMRRALELPANTDLAELFADLNKDLGLPATLGEMGVEPSVFDTVAAWSEADHSTATNPVPMKAADFRTLLEAAL